MSEVLAIALASMHQDMGQADRIAQNLANVSTPGYRRAVAAARPFAEAIDAAAASRSPVVVGSAAPGVQEAPGALQVLVDGRPGTLRMTGQPLDLALEGEGYFEVATPSGPAYTRQGSFALDGQGRLVTASGHAVMGTGGEIRLTTRTPAIDANGKISEPDAMSSFSTPGSVAQLRVVRFAKDAELRQLGDGLLAPTQGAVAGADSGTLVRQGALENSNVSSLQEMIQLMQTVRHFESMQKVVQGYDDLLSTSIRKLGDLS